MSEEASDDSTVTTSLPGLPDHASIGRVLKDQRKTEAVALILIGICIWWFLISPHGWQLPTSLAAGVVLGLGNHIATEYWLLKMITSGDSPTRGEMGRSTMVRLIVLTVLAIGVAALMWPDGVAVLFGLAIFRLIALVMTNIPLLKEMRKR